MENGNAKPGSSLNIFVSTPASSNGRHDTTGDIIDVYPVIAHDQSQ